MTLAKCANAELIAIRHRRGMRGVCAREGAQSRDASSRLLVRFCFHLFLPGGDAHRTACAAGGRYGALSPVSARAGPCSRATVGLLLRSICIPQRANICGGTSSGFALISICRFGDPNPFHKKLTGRARCVNWIERLMGRGVLPRRFPGRVRGMSSDR